MTTTGSGPKEAKAKSTATTAATDTAAGAAAPDSKKMSTEPASPQSRAAKVTAFAIVAVVMLGSIVFVVYSMAQRSFKDDVAAMQDSVGQYFMPILTPPPAKPIAVAQPPIVQQTASSMSAADLTNPCRQLLKGMANDYSKADLACLNSSDTFEGISVTADQAARFCHGITKVNPVAGMKCVSGMYRKVHNAMRPNERRLDYVVSKK